MSIEVLCELEGRDHEILTKEALLFVETLEREFGERRRELLHTRKKRQARLNSGERPDFLKETEEIRKSDWKIAPIPKDLEDRRVEITGPPTRKMVINALNSGAKTFMADLEDSNAPTWRNQLDGQCNLYDAIRRQIDFTDPTSGKEYKLSKQPAVLLVRPRGWHLEEKHLLLDGKAISGSLFDFALYLFHNGKELLARDSGPYFYLPKLEGHLEARLWNDVFVRAQELLGIPQGSIKATVLIETILAAFEMDEILYELKEHSSGLNCGRWDYIFSFIKRFQADQKALFPDRAQVTMETPFMRAYSLLSIKTCHRRGAHAIGGMAAQIPIKNDPAANQKVLDFVRKDKRREVVDGHDGTWVAHPGLVALAFEEFDSAMPDANQIHKLRKDVKVTAHELLALPEGTISEKGLRQNITVAVQYLAAWLRGNGCVALYNLMEDAATAEISRTQVWQWVHHPGAKLEDGREITLDLFQKLLAEELTKLDGDYQEAAQLFSEMIAAKELYEFLTEKAYIKL